MRSFITIILVFTHFTLFSQEYKQAIVTDLNFIRRSGEGINDESFPFYFTYKDFAIDIQADIRKHLIEKFKVEEVLFLNPDSILYLESSIAPKTEARDYAEYTNRENTIFISIETILQHSSANQDERIFKFTTRLNVYNSKAKSIYKFKNHIPFVTVFGDEIAGWAEMSEKDFYTFYFDGLFLAFNGKYQSVTKRYVVKPTEPKYLDFTNSANKFYVLTESSAYTYGSDKSELAELLYFTINYWDNNSDSFDFMNLVTLEFLDNGYTFINRLDTKEYTVKLKGGVNTFKSKFDAMADIDMQILDAEKKHMGYFTYKDVARLSGTYKGVKYRLEWKIDYNCLEVYIENKLMALINYYPNEKILFLDPDFTREQYTAIANLLFVYDYSLALRTRVFSFYN